LAEAAMESKPRFELILRRFGARLVQTPVTKTDPKNSAFLLILQLLAFKNLVL
jgi:hypothetical protein